MILTSTRLKFGKGNDYELVYDKFEVKSGDCPHCGIFIKAGNRLSEGIPQNAYYAGGKLVHKRCYHVNGVAKVFKTIIDRGKK